jgi:hypothetical protein
MSQFGDKRGFGVAEENVVKGNDPVAGMQTEYSGSRIADALCRGNHLPGWLLEIRSAFEKSESGFSSSSSCSSSILAGFFENEDEDDDEDDSSP